MKKMFYLILLSLFAACGILKQNSPSDEAEEFVISRKFIGNFIDFRYTAPEEIAGQHIIWIKTTMESAYGKISAIGKKCDFQAGERLYLKRTLYDPGIGAGYWVYHIENESSDTFYEATEFQHDRKVSIETWFQKGFENNR